MQLWANHGWGSKAFLQLEPQAVPAQLPRPGPRVLLRPASRPAAAGFQEEEAAQTGLPYGLASEARPHHFRGI